MTHGVFGKIHYNFIFVTDNICDMRHVTHVTCDVFIMTIELNFVWAFHKYNTHWVFVKIVCNLIFVTCNMCDMWHVTCNMHCIALHCIALYCITLHYITLHCTVFTVTWKCWFDTFQLEVWRRRRRRNIAKCWLAAASKKDS